MPNVTIGFGAANFKGAAVSFAALKVEAPFTKTSAANSGKEITGTRTYTPAGRLDLHKGFGRKGVDHPEGTILLFQGYRTRNGIRVADGAIFLRMRTGAPLYHVYGKVPAHPDNTCGDTVMVFSGQADILDVKGCASFGIAVPRGFVQDRMQQDEIDDVFMVRKLLDATSLPPVISEVQTDRGIEARMIGEAPVRRLRLRR